MCMAVERSRLFAASSCLCFCFLSYIILLFLFMYWFLFFVVSFCLFLLFTFSCFSTVGGINIASLFLQFFGLDFHRFLGSPVYPEVTRTFTQASRSFSAYVVRGCSIFERETTTRGIIEKKNQYKSICS